MPSFLLLGAALALAPLAGCSDEESGSSPAAGGSAGSSGASAGQAGAGAAGKAGGSSGAAGQSGAGNAGQAGAGQAGAGAAGAAGEAGSGGQAGGAGQGGAGQAGAAGGGAAGEAGQAGQAGAAGEAGQAGTAGAAGQAGTAGAAGSAGEGGAAGSGPVKPPECGELTLSGPLGSSQMSDPEYYDAQPDLYAGAALDGATGDPDHPNTFVFYLDAANQPGVYPVAPLVPYPYVISNGGLLASDYGGDPAGYARRYIAVSGSIEVTSVLTPHQTEGTLAGIRLDEAEMQDDGTYTFPPGGKCFWLKQATWSTKRAGGCKPFSDGACGGGLFCMPTNAIGDDGVCVSTGDKKVGDACALVSPDKHDSDCAPGLRCARFEDEGETAFTCHQLCDVRSAAPGCPADAHCGGGYSVCISTAFLQDHPDNGDEIDSVAKIGEECKETPDALYCGADGQPGTCFTYSGETASICRPFRHALSECEPGESAGYITYKNGADSSTLLCFK